MTIVLDADGVFLSERPYWETALRTAWKELRLTELDRAQRRRLSDLAWGSVGLQWVAKRLGCNSNWDLTAVLEQSLFSSDQRDRVDLALQRGELEAALQLWKRACEGLSEINDKPEATTDPLLRFGIDRRGRQFADVVDRFQECYQAIQSQLELDELALDQPAELASALRKLPSLPRVCTGRPRDELESPLARLKLDRRFDLERSITCSDIPAALGKPHPYPLLRCLYDRATVDRWLDQGDSLPSDVGAVLYVGDSLSDLLAAQATAEAGVSLTYLHRLSGSTTDAVRQRLQAASCFRGTLDTIGDLPARLEGLPR